MVIYYALGGGLGHVSRAKKVLASLRMPTYKIITACPNASLVVDKDQIIPLSSTWSQQPERLFFHIITILADENAHTFMVDTFPSGIMGELNITQLQPLYRCCYIARYVNWPLYSAKYIVRGDYHTSYIVDYLHPEQKNYIESFSHSIRYLTLACQESREHTDIPLQRPSWLIAHSGPISEVKELMAYAKEMAALENIEPFYLIASTLQMDEKNVRCQTINQYPINHLFSQVDKIISACGFNIMLETQAYRDKHHFIPFPRKYDDQFLRAKRSRQ
ncbi:hypothetical protein N9J26_00625 [bacterium]|nr:hypothetical protein [bacterium]